MNTEGADPAGRFVITGMSGAGKTCLLERLRARGRLCFGEVVRATLREQLAVDGPALPAKDPGLFVSELLRLSLRDLDEASARGGISFFDRGIPDLIVYARRFGVDPGAFDGAAARHRYSRRAFILPPWREIFVNDEFRRASFDDYCNVHAMIVSAYLASDYELVEVPRVDVEARADFVEREILRRM